MELFFDLVFVFALIQVTATMAADLSWPGVGRGLLVVALLWWSWVVYSWLGNFLRLDEGVARLGMFTAIVVMFALALAIPEAFRDRPGELSGPLVVAGSYLTVRTVHVALFYAASATDPGLRRQVLRFAPTVPVAGGLLLAAAAVGREAGAGGAVQAGLWAGALAVDYLGTYLAGARGWRIRSAEHFAERHRLIVLVALGESIVAIGVGVGQLPVSWQILLASALGVTLSAALWSVYYDAAGFRAVRAVEAAPEPRRAGLAQDAYTYLHLPMVAGIVLVALGLKTVLELVGDEREHSLGDPLEGVGLSALVGGVVLFLLAQQAFTLRTGGHVNWSRLTAGALILALLPVGRALPALATLGLLTTTVAAAAGRQTRGAIQAPQRSRAAPAGGDAVP